MRGKSGGREGLVGEAWELGAWVPRSHRGQAQSQDNYMPSFADCIKIIRMRDLKNCTLSVELGRALETGTGIPKANLVQLAQIVLHKQILSHIISMTFSPQHPHPPFPSFSPTCRISAQTPPPPSSSSFALFLSHTLPCSFYPGGQSGYGLWF